MKILLKKLLYFVVSFVIVFFLTLAITPNKQSLPVIHAHNAAVQTSVGEYSIIERIITNVGQAANFSHPTQLRIDYLLVLLISLLIAKRVNYQYFKPQIIRPPWYFCLRYHSRLSISGWKVSNLLYQYKHYCH